MLIISMQASAMPPTTDQRVSGRAGIMAAPEVAAVVLIVRVAMPAVDPVILTGLVEPKLNVGRFAAPVGLDLRVATSATLPVNPLVGMTVMVVEFPLVAPRANVRLAEPGLSARPGVGGGAPVETRRLTEEPAATAVPAAGLSLITLPEATVLLDAVVTVPTVRPAVVIAVDAAAWVSPTTFGTLIWTGAVTVTLTLPEVLPVKLVSPE
jgi:hypothetical protein